MNGRLGDKVWLYCVNPECPGFTEWTSSLKFGCTPCIRVLAPFGHFTFVSSLWLSNSLFSLSAFEFALRNSSCRCQVPIISEKSYLFLIVSMTCRACRKRKLHGGFEKLRCSRKHSADLLKQFRIAAAADSVPLLDTSFDKITCLQLRVRYKWVYHRSLWDFVLFPNQNFCSLGMNNVPVSSCGICEAHLISCTE